MSTLAKTNKHLSSAAKRKESVFITVSTSSAIDGIRAPFKRAQARTLKQTITNGNRRILSAPKG